MRGLVQLSRALSTGTLQWVCQAPRLWFNICLGILEAVGRLWRVLGHQSPAVKFCFALGVLASTVAPGTCLPLSSAAPLPSCNVQSWSVGLDTSKGEPGSGGSTGGQSGEHARQQHKRCMLRLRAPASSLCFDRCLKLAWACSAQRGPLSHTAPDYNISGTGPPHPVFSDPTRRKTS